MLFFCDRRRRLAVHPQDLMGMPASGTSHESLLGCGATIRIRENKSLVQVDLVQELSDDPAAGVVANDAGERHLGF